jgi:membrane associated rhomboid family serine protease
MTTHNPSPSDLQSGGQGRAGAPVGVWLLTALVVAAYIWQVSRSEQAGLRVLFDYAVIPARYDPAAGAAYAGLIAALTPLVSHAFLHGGFVHLTLNAVALLALGKALALRVGSAWLCLVFVVGAAAGAGLFIVLNPGLSMPLVGCSGAVCAIYGAIVADLLREARGAWGALRRREILVQAAMFLALNVVLAMAVRATGVIAIAWEAHLGGFIAGTVLGFLRR